MLHVMDRDAGCRVATPEIGVSECQHPAARPEGLHKVDVGALVAGREERIAGPALDTLGSIKDERVSSCGNLLGNAGPVSPGRSDKGAGRGAETLFNFGFAGLQVSLGFGLIQILELSVIELAWIGCGPAQVDHAMGSDFEHTLPYSQGNLMNGLRHSGPDR
jgi:hypothetical protein